MTGQPDEVLAGGALDFNVDHTGQGSSLQLAPEAFAMPDHPGSAMPGMPSARLARPKLDPLAFVLSTDLILELIQEIYPEPCCETGVSANRLIVEKRPHDVRAWLTTSASGGGRLLARLGAINWHLDQLASAGVLRKSGRSYRRTPSKDA